MRIEGFDVTYPMMRMFSMCMLCHGKNGHFLSETVYAL